MNFWLILIPTCILLWILVFFLSKKTGGGLGAR